MKNITLLIIILPLCLSGGCSRFSHAQELTSFEVLEKLSQLQPLAKVHYSWPVPDYVNNAYMNEYTRITHALTISGEWVKESQLDRCVRICAQVNNANPKIPATLAVNFSPWHIRFKKDLPPTERGESYWDELTFFEERCYLIKDWLKLSNTRNESDISITAVTLDSERFVVRENDPIWNEAIREALDQIHIMTRKIFPNARIEWYGRGIQHNQSETGWSKSGFWTGNEIKSPLSCSLYTVPELERTRETFRRTCILADQMQINDVTPWVALAAGAQRHPTKFQVWKTDWDYDLVYSWLIGAELNHPWYAERPDRFAPYNRAKIVIFYPPPFDKRSPSWTKHFIAYVRGATGNTDLTDLGNEQE